MGEYNYAYFAAALFGGAFYGVIEAEIIAFSLLEISISSYFPYIFGVGFCLLSFALAWRIWVSVPGSAKYVMLFFSALVLASGIACFFLKAGLMKNLTAPAKVPLYALIGVSFAFTITYTFSEIVMLSPWDRYCGTNSQENPLFGSQQQIFALFIVSLLLGASFGLLFGLIDVEDNYEERLLTNTIYGIPIGLGVGGVFGIINEWYRQRKPEAPVMRVGPQDTDALL